MTNIKKLLILASSLVIIGLIGCIFTKKTSNFSLSNIINGTLSYGLNKTSYSTIEEEISIEESFSKIVCTTQNALIKIKPSSSSNTRVKVSNIPEITTYDFTALVSDNTLDINFKQKSSFNSLNGFKDAIILEIFLPEKEYESIESKTSNASISVEDIFSKEIDLETSNSKISLNDTISDKVNLNTSNGKIYVDSEISKKLIASTSNSKIDANLKSLDISIDLSSSNGSIEIEGENKPTNVTFDCQTSNSKITIYDKKVESLVIGNGDNLIKLTTSNAKITVN